MSDVAPESQGPGQPPADPGSQPMGTPMARYTIHIPSANRQDGRDLSYVLGAVRQALTQAGYNGRTVIRKAQGDWQNYDTEDMDLVMVDAPDDPQHLQAIMQIAQGAKMMSGHPALYITKQPVETFIV